MKNSSKEEEVPCLITTLNRYHHFVECIESLRKNIRTKEIRLVIALDYPLNEEHWDGYQKICEYLKQDFGEFHSTEVIKRNTNFGAGRNFREAREYLFKKYDKIICSEDDNVFSPNFLDYILKGFQLYDEHKDVFAICGYSYPVCWTDDRNTIVRSLTLYSAWGYGIWRERYEQYYLEYDKDYILDLVNDRKRLMKLRKMSKNLFFYLISEIGEKSIHKGDSGISIYITDKNYCCILPKKSLVRNMGHDGSGIHCHEKSKYDFSKQEIDTSSEFNYRYIDDFGEKRNMELLDQYVNRGLWRNIRVILQYVLFKIVGFSRYTKIKKVAKKLRVK